MKTVLGLPVSKFVPDYDDCCYSLQYDSGLCDRKPRVWFFFMKLQTLTILCWWTDKLFVNFSMGHKHFYGSYRKLSMPLVSIKQWVWLPIKFLCTSIWYQHILDEYIWADIFSMILCYTCNDNNSTCIVAKNSLSLPIMPININLEPFLRNVYTVGACCVCGNQIADVTHILQGYFTSTGAITLPHC